MGGMIGGGFPPEPRNATDFTPDESKIFQYMGVWYDPLEVNHKLQICLGGRAEQMIRLRDDLNVSVTRGGLRLEDAASIDERQRRRHGLI